MALRVTVILVVAAGASFGGWADLDFDVGFEVEGRGGFSAPNLLRHPGGAAIGIVVAEGDIGVVCYDLEGARLWEYAMTPRITVVPAVADVDGDGAEEVLAVDGTGNVVLLDAAGRKVWSAKAPAAALDDSCPAVADLDGDGRPEVLVSDISGALSCFDHRGALAWRFTGDGTQMGPILAADIYDADGKEIIVTSHDNHIYALTARGEWLWDLYTPDDLFPNSTPILADVDGDATPELYIGGGLHHFYRIDLESHEIVLAENVFLHVNSAIAATDLDGDGADEVVFGNKNGGVWCYGAAGFQWTHEFRNSSFLAGPLILNIDADPALEILFVSSRGDLQVIDNDGTMLASLETPCGPLATPLAGDLDGDGKLELVVTSTGGHRRGGTLVRLDFDVSYRDDPRNVTTFAGNHAHTGRAPGAKRYPLLPTPIPATAPAEVLASAEGDLRLLTGPNTWRFDVLNPDSRRLAMRLDLRYPDGRVERFVRHVRGPEERVQFPFEITVAGTYQMECALIDADTLAVYASDQKPVAFKGFASDQGYLDTILGETDRVLEEWRPSNPTAASSIQNRLLSLKGLLREARASGRVERLSAVRDEAERLRALATAGAALAPTGSFFAWEFNPWAYFDARATLPTPEDATDRLAASVCVGEYESLALNVTNLAGGTLEVQVSAGDLAVSAGDLVVSADDLEGSETFPAADHVAFRRAATVPTIRRERVADALPRLDQGALLPVGPLETAQLWITVNAEGLKPGDYEAELRLASVEPDPTAVSVPIHIHVDDLALPRPRPLRFCTWAYDGGTLGTDKPHVLEDLVDHGVSVFFPRAPSGMCDERGDLVGPLDFAAHDESVQRFSPHGILLFASPQGGLKGQPFLSDPWRKGFVAFMRAWAAHMNQLGLDYDRWALYPYDEPSTPFTETTLNLVEVAKLVREANPNILVYTDPTSGTTMKSVEMFTGLIDIWCPSSELLERLPEIIPAAQRVGKAVWFYDAAGHAKTLSCLGIYRWRFWYAWNLGLTGVGWWCYSRDVDVAWQGPNPYADFFGSVYAGPGDAVVTSKRWEAAREGVEDYEYLWLLRAAIADAEARGASGPELEGARRVLREVPPAIEAALHQAGRRLPLTPDGAPLYDQIAQQLRQAREQIVTACLRLKP